MSKYAYVLFYKRRPTANDFVKQLSTLEQAGEAEQAVDTKEESLEDIDENELDWSTFVEYLV